MWNFRITLAIVCGLLMCQADLVAASSSFPVLSLGSAGKEFGAGYAGGIYYRPSVSTTGKVSFVALDEQYSPWWLNSYQFDAEGGLRSLFPVVQGSSAPNERKFTRSVWEEEGAGGFSRIYYSLEPMSTNIGEIGLEHMDASGKISFPLVLNAGDHVNLKLEDVHIASADLGEDGILYVINGGSYSCVKAKLKRDGTWEMGESLGAVLNPTSYAMVLSGKGRYLFYSTVHEGATKIYRYDLSQGGEPLFIGLAHAGSSRDPYVSCSEDGSQVAYTCSIPEECGSTTSQVLVRTILADGTVTRALVVSAVGENHQTVLPGVSQLADCADLFFARSGNFLAFAGQVSLNGNLVWQVFRYDLMAGNLEIVSRAGDKPALGDCRVPALSADGRIMAFVASDGSDLVGGESGYSKVILADCGPSLVLPEKLMGDGKDMDLQIQTSVKGTFRLSVKPAAKGRFTFGDGTQLSMDKNYSTALLPVIYHSTEAETMEVEVCAQEGSLSLSGSMEVSVVPDATALGTLSVISLNDRGAFPTDKFISYSSLALSEDGRQVLFATNATLLNDNASFSKQDLFWYGMDGGSNLPSMHLLASGIAKASLSGDGQTAVFVKDGQLYRQALGASSASLVCAIQGAVSRLGVSYDGQTLAWLKDGGLRVQRGETQQFALENVTDMAVARDGLTVVYLNSNHELLARRVDASESHVIYQGTEALGLCGLSLSGHMVYFLEKGMLHRLPLVEGADSVKGTLGDFSGRQRVLVSANGLVALSTSSETPTQVYVRDLQTQEERLVSSSDGLDSGDRNSDSSLAPACLSGDGSTLVFLSNATNLVLGDDNGQQDLFMWKDTGFANVKLELQGLAGDGDEDRKMSFEIIPETVTGENVLLSLGTAAWSRQGGKITLGAPAWGRAAYRLDYEPKQDFCGDDVVELHVYDGTETKTVEFGISVRNVNDAPVWSSPIYELTAQENQLATLTLSDKVTDPDLNNPVPDVLSFGVSQLDGVELKNEEGKLTILAGYEAVNRTTDGTAFEIQLTVTDKAGEKATAKLTLTIENVNRPPQAPTGPIALQEGVPFETSTLGFSDEDQEDKDALQYTFAVASGSFKDKDQKPVVLSEPVASSRFPLTYTGDGQAANAVKMTIVAQDAEPSSTSVTATMSLKRQSHGASELWGGTDGEDGKMVWQQLKRGWNLLAVPVTLAGPEYEAFRQWLNPAAVWTWDTVAGRYVQTEKLSANQGFWAYLDQLPADRYEIVGDSTVDAEQAALPGWQLISAGDAEALFRYDAKAGCLIRCEKQAPAGLGAWRYVRSQASRP